MLSYGAFDSPTYYIDITPFIPHLSDGLSHSFTINVAGMGANYTINDSWIVSGNVQVSSAISKFCERNENPTRINLDSFG